MKKHSLFRNNRPFIRSGLAALMLSAVAVLSASAGQLPKAWMDEASGYAIAGFDPVNYFVKGEALRPTGAIEAFWGGVSWKFRHTGNRDAFLSHPRTYMPRFGGADPYLLTKRRAVLGNPFLFEVYKGRLYFFYDGMSLSRWKQHRAAFVIHAKQVWPQVAASLGLDGAEPVNPAPGSGADGFLPMK